MFFEVWDLSKFKIYEWRSVGLKSNSCAVHAKKVYALFVNIFLGGREIFPGGDFSPPPTVPNGGGDFSPQGDFPLTWRSKGGGDSPPPPPPPLPSIMNIEFVITTHQHNLFYLIIALFHDPEHFLFLWRKNFLFGTERLWAIFALQSFLIQDCRLSKMDFHSLMKK